MLKKIIFLAAILSCFVFGAITVSACAHTPTAATCTSGSKCSKCGYTFSGPLGHNNNGATCTSAGHCSRCGKTGTALGHNYGNPTCTTPGKCSRCTSYSGSPLGHSYSGRTCTSGGSCTRCGTSGSPLGHNYSAATCTSGGTCSRCQAKGSPLGHNFNIGATCTTAIKCSRCSSTQGSPLGHSYSGRTCTSGGSCTRCGTSGSPLGHNYGNPTCTTPGKCSRCSSTQGSPLGHSYSGRTCTSGGSCTRCGTSGSPLGHNYSAATCTSGGTCSRCQAKDSPLGHNFNIGATCIAPIKCSRCPATQGSPLGHSYSGQTCTSGGSCTRCSTSGSPLGHNYSAATCTMPGQCSRCSSTTGTPLGHDYTQATCTTEGVCRRTGCNSTKSALGHDYVQSISSGHEYNGHYYTSRCSRCDIAGSSGYCASPSCCKCGTIPHSYGSVWYAATHPHAGYKTCSLCSDNESAGIQASFYLTDVISSIHTAQGHEKYKECSICGKLEGTSTYVNVPTCPLCCTHPAGGIIIDTSSVHETAGHKVTETCGNCGDVLRTYYISKLGCCDCGHHNYGPDITGEHKDGGHDITHVCTVCGHSETIGEKVYVEDCEGCNPIPPGGTGGGPLGAPSITDPDEPTVLHNMDVVIRWNQGANATDGVTTYTVSIRDLTNNTSYSYSAGTDLSYTIPAGSLTLGKAYSVTVTAKEEDKADSPPSSAITFSVVGGATLSVGEVTYNSIELIISNPEQRTLQVLEDGHPFGSYPLGQNDTVKVIDVNPGMNYYIMLMSPANVMEDSVSVETIILPVKGDRGIAVYEIQFRLKHGDGTVKWWVNPDGTSSTAKADGIFGDITEASIKKFQEYCVTKGYMTITDFQLGELNPKTYNKLKELTPNIGIGAGYCPHCGIRFSKYTTPPELFGYADIWDYSYSSSLRDQAISLFDAMGFETGAGKSDEHRRVLLSANIIMFQYKTATDKSQITGILDQYLIDQLNAANQAHETYATISAKPGCGGLSDSSGRPNFPSIPWTIDDYYAVTGSELLSRLTGTKQDVDGYTVIPANGGSDERVLGSITPMWTGVDQWIAVRWAQLIESAAVAVKLDGEGNVELDGYGNPIPLNLDMERLRVSAYDSGFRTFYSQEYYWHIYQLCNAKKGNPASTPGKSPHGVGYAVDFNTGTECGYYEDRDGDGVKETKVKIPMPNWSAEGKYLEYYGHNHGMSGNQEEKGTDGIYKYYETWHWEYNQ